MGQFGSDFSCSLAMNTCYFEPILDLCCSLDNLHSFNFINCFMISLPFIASYKGSLTRNYYSKLYSLAHILSYECFLCS